MIFKLTNPLKILNKIKYKKFPKNHDHNLLISNPYIKSNPKNDPSYYSLAYKTSNKEKYF